MKTGLSACPSCACHVRAAERSCPHCGASFARARCDRRTAAAVMLGLSASVTFAVDGCGSDVSVPSGGAGGTGQTAQAGGDTSSIYTHDASTISTYGVAPTSSVAAPASSSTGGSKGVCDTGADCAKCEQSACAAAFCMGQIDKCQKNPECVAIQSCLARCKPNDGACFNSCISAHMNGSTDLFNLLNCEICSPGPCYGDCAGASSCMK